MALRLAALGLGAFLLAALSSKPVVRPLGRTGPASSAAGGALGAASLLAAALLAVAVAADSLPRVGQWLFVPALGLPALITARRSAWAPLRSALPGPVVAVALVWLVWRFVEGWDSPRLATPVDTWLGLDYLERALRDGTNLLTEGFLPGVPATYLLFQGVAFATPTHGTHLALVLGLHGLWMAIAGLAIGHLTATWITRGAAPVATAAFLFSPFALLVPLNPTPYFLGPLMGVSLLLALSSFHRTRSVAAMLALAALGGLCVSMPPVAPFAAGVALAAFGSWYLGSRPPWLALLTASFVFAAAAWPGLPDLEDLGAMIGAYTESRGLWVGLETMLLGLVSPQDAQAFWTAGRPAPWDIPVGTLLAPFAIPRTPLRLWGDALFDPLGAALAACGIAVCLRHVRHSGAALLLVMLALGLATGFVSSFDRPSHTRIFVAPVPLALLAAIGFEAARRIFGDGRASFLPALGVTLGIGVGGFLLFDFVNPRILARSSLTLALEALREGTPDGGAIVLAHGRPGEFDWLHVRRIMKRIGPEGTAVESQERLEALAGSAELLLWSPGLEGDARIALRTCARWPKATLYTVTDPAGVAKLYAAARDSIDWRPGVSASRWTAQDCAGRSNRPRPG